MQIGKELEVFMNCVLVGTWTQVGSDYSIIPGAKLASFDIFSGLPSNAPDI